MSARRRKLGEALRLMGMMGVVCFQETHADTEALQAALRPVVRGGALFVPGSLGGAGRVATYVSEDLVGMSNAVRTEFVEARVQRLALTDRDTSTRTNVSSIHNFGIRCADFRRMRRGVRGETQRACTF